ncbi:T9SS type A sorting domain-containing protein [Hymenobacter sp. BT683]|uniref:T9SS type A sorting domain-containing protein n=1 Tax=Hymenobacter jeongseonensis TaxID=2791027 RepID=A0ABS0ILX2_9BACT|nr:T9SS type A sorting domain-containing protein [Hymenobacter jeongseonensis]
MATSSGGSCSPVPVSGSGATIVIDGVSIEMAADYTVGRGGSITLKSTNPTRDGILKLTATNRALVIGDDADLFVNDGGVLILPSTAPSVNAVRVQANGSIAVTDGGAIRGGNLMLGDNRAAQRNTNLRVSGLAAVELDQITANKGTLTIASGATLITACNMVVINGLTNIEGLMVINGNLDLSGGDITACGTGKMAVRGCVFANPGQLSQLLNPQPNPCGAGKPSMCVRRNNNLCPGPIAPIANAICVPASALPAADPTACLPLPVELIEFTAELVSRQQVALRWATASEKNNKDFTIERSANGQQFQDLQTLAGAGNKQSLSTYSAVDELPLPGTSYYRLRQTDFDGTRSYSPVRAVKRGNAPGMLEVYPGRTTQEWAVSSNLPPEAVGHAATSIQLLDALGRAQPVAATSDAAQTGRWYLNVQQLPAGIYIVRLLTPAGTYSQRMAR